MPKNNNLPATTLPMKLRFNESPNTNFKNNLESINIELISAPTMDELRSYLPQFVTATWQEYGDDQYNGNLALKEKDDIILFIVFPTIAIIGMLFIIAGINITPTAIDVYKGKTELQITYKGTIPIDSVVVFKNK